MRARLSLSQCWAAAASTACVLVMSSTELSTRQRRSQKSSRVELEAYAADLLQPAPAGRSGSHRCCVKTCEGRLQQAYELRTGLCSGCMRAPKILVGADKESQRFCQQCHKPHALVAFDGLKSSCSESLAKFNARRREKRRAGKGGGTVLVGLATSSHPSTEPASRELSPALTEVEEPPSAGEDVDPFAAFLSGSGLLGATQRFRLALEESDWTTAHLKLPDADSAAELPRADVLASALCLEPSLQLLNFTLRPGCLVLTFDMVGEVSVERLAAELRGAFRGHRAGAGGVLRMGGESESLNGPAVASVARPARPLPACAAMRLEDGAYTLFISLTQPLAAGSAPVARVTGQALPITAAGLELRLACSPDLTRGGRGALLILECETDGGHGNSQFAVSDAVPMLLSRSRKLCAEVNASTVSAQQTSQAVAWLGLALQGDAPLARRMRAAGACLAAGWRHALAELLLCGGAPAVPPTGSDALALALWLHAAASCAPRARAAAALDALQTTGWTALLGGDGWGGKDAENSWGAARRHAGTLLMAQATDPGEGGTQLISALVAAELADAAAAKEGGWREAAARPFIHSAVLMLSAEIAPGPTTAPQDAAEGALEAGGPTLSGRERIAALAGENVNYHLVITFLMVLGHVFFLSNAWRCVLLRDSWPRPDDLERTLGKMNSITLAETRLWPLGDPSAPSFSPTEVSWEVVTRCTRIQVAFSLFVLTPTYIAMAAAALLHTKRRLPIRLYLPIFAGGAFVEQAGYVLTDVLIFYHTGAVVEWPSLGSGLVYAAVVASLTNYSPFTHNIMRCLFAAEVVTVGLPLLLARLPHVLLRNVQLMAQILASGYNLTKAQQREAAVLARVANSRRKKNE